MMRVYSSVCLLVGSFLRILSPAKGDVADAEVSCVFMESCILPCSFQAGGDLIIHWNQVTAGNTPVHSYYYNQDQLTQQAQRFRGRTSLFKDQISRGNASLQLTRVEVQDQGRYQCYTSSIYDSKESFINIKVDDAEVSCVFMESCILPCSFQAADDLVLHWNQVTGNTPVHSYYRNQDQLTYQDQRFRGRTSLFKDQITRGNASLQLTRVEVQDQGRYQCYTSTIYDGRESFINLKVDALVRKVDIQQVGNRITCSSEGIYPEPELTWSTSPPSNETFSNTTTVQKTEQQLYNISSSLILSHSLTDLDFSCTISTRRNWRRETLRQSYAEVSCVFMESCILPCSFQAADDLVLHWNQVTGNTPVHSYYYNQDQLTHQDQRFRGRTSLLKDQISRGNASLQLTRVEVQDQGRYQCYTNTNYTTVLKTFINLIVDAPVRKVDIQQVGNRITCSSEGIYPEPELTWSTSPPSNETFRNTTTVQKTEQQLYNISSSLILSHSLTDLDFSCNISTRRNWRRETLRQSWSQTHDSSVTVGVVVGVVLVVLLTGLVLYCKRRKERGKL